MFWNDSKKQEAIFNWLSERFKFNKRMKLIPVDFNLPWWKVLWDQKWIVTLTFFNIMLYSLAATLTPAAIGYIFVSGNLSYFYYLCGILLLVRIINTVLFYFDPVLRMQTPNSVEQAAIEYFLKVDPIHHSTRSSGQILAKISRGSQAYEILIDIISFTILSFIGNLFGVVIGFWIISPVHAVSILIFVFVLMLINISLYLLRTRLLSRFRIETADKFKSKELETIQQVNFIRGVFGTKEQLESTKKSNFKFITTQAVGWRATGYIVTISQIIFTISILVLGISIWNINSSARVVVVALLISYFQLGDKLNFIGQSFNRLLMSLEDINDLFSFIRNFGKQSYPVLQDDLNKSRKII